MYTVCFLYVTYYIYTICELKRQSLTRSARHSSPSLSSYFPTFHMRLRHIQLKSFPAFVILILA